MTQLTNRSPELRARWKHPFPQKRFAYSQCDDLWQIEDHKYGICFTFGNGKYWEQVKGMWFVRNYVRIHGDINLNSMPYTLDDPLNLEGLPAEEDR